MSSSNPRLVSAFSPSPCWRRVAEMKAQGVFKGTVLLVDPLKLGLAVNVFVHAFLQQQDKHSLEVFISVVQRHGQK
ncbi:Lrp/AsnC family transcriptional regulator [Acetobacter ascendens]|uniref:Lrp/AsnC family transcriptional regulator n=1 Tax=Acetobacter ascendens TaxID=481146 RepID=UPI00200E70B4|nr:hypothetical protein [Acetobacter ascendens]